MRTLRVLQSMMLAVRIEMPAGSRETRSIAFCILMNVNGVHSRRQILDVKLKIDALPAGNRRKRRRPDAFSGCILQFNGRALREPEHSAASDTDE